MVEGKKFYARISNFVRSAKFQFDLNIYCESGPIYPICKILHDFLNVIWKFSLRITNSVTANFEHFMGDSFVIHQYRKYIKKFDFLEANTERESFQFISGSNLDFRLTCDCFM